ncbi:hypothetical protein TanjilG_27867 [Lupinus angustifolius]|uniref:Uncharacterized protein n=1 Tax=Lupinus angustifolius TaxID=3871 RepID=A0A4P1RHF4_LUPAN|nr:hypothetical protein TanjilG_27867 [Lupinus angustifolius]
MKSQEIKIKIKKIQVPPQMKSQEIHHFPCINYKVIQRLKIKRVVLLINGQNLFLGSWDSLLVP